MKPTITNNFGKGSKSEYLPSRTALATISSGDPSKRTINNYAKATPGLEEQTPNVLAMGRKL